ncbi:zinc-binding metallopeptidase family protein [Pararhizobium sp.]|uniref:zinc-binding metallopeptidase family protein n=1 Tax=Pararhizobium sp. TaxID=1977563 RepID=UPI002718C40B|nr:putative zinc-binding metallopeptidase [Pararhizobium sp.]MDO9415779.1 putative zinc-binding metallopeptidase [Pararhizobium sp.]
MRLFQCDNCGQPVHFDNRACMNCGDRLGFIAETASIHALVPVGNNLWEIRNKPGQQRYFCANANLDICNWTQAPGNKDGYCEACHFNRTVPVTNTEEGISRWNKIGQAQRHLFYSLIRWNLPRPDRVKDPVNGLVFDFLADETGADGLIVPAMTGHEDGLISLRAAEADDAVREYVRVSMREPYRTLLGHFRHEVGHFYWAQLVRDEKVLAEARALFGDERADYAAALRKNYENGPPVNWQSQFISSYASSHPSEDFAECWAHYFHIVDTLETARSFGLSIEPAAHHQLDAEVTFDPYKAPNAQRLADAWIPLSVAINSIQRSMGQRDSYPFVLSPPVIKKLDFINRLILRKS